MTQQQAVLFLQCPISRGLAQMIRTSREWRAVSVGPFFLGERDTCSSCGGRDTLEKKRLGNTGKLYSYSIVFRSFPGIDVPYISAIVDLDGGGTVKGNLIGIDPDPANLAFDMPVDVIFDDALGRKDKEGNSYISYFFKPAA